MHLNKETVQGNDSAQGTLQQAKFILHMIHSAHSGLKILATSLIRAVWGSQSMSLLFLSEASQSLSEVNQVMLGLLIPQGFSDEGVHAAAVLLHKQLCTLG